MPDPNSQAAFWDYVEGLLALVACIWLFDLACGRWGLLGMLLRAVGMLCAYWGNKTLYKAIV